MIDETAAFHSTSVCQFCNLHATQVCTVKSQVKKKVVSFPFESFGFLIEQLGLTFGWMRGW
jgi:hypothetical protein